MANIKFFSNNFLEQAQLSASNVDPFYPLANIQHDFTTKVCRTTTGNIDLEVVIDLGTTETVNSFLIKGHSQTGWNLIEGVDVESDPSGAFSGSETDHGDIPITEAEFNLGYLSISDTASRYWRFTFTGSTYGESTKLFLGDYIQLANNNIDFNWTYERRDLSRARKNRYGQKFFDTVESQDMIKANFNLLNISEVETILDMYEDRKTYKPLWIIVDEDETIINDLERFAGYFFFRRRPVVTNVAYGLYNLSIELEEGM